MQSAYTFLVICLRLPLSDDTVYPAYNNFVSFVSRRLFWRFRFARFEVVF